MTKDQFPPALLDWLRTSKHLAILTGAGVSQESGIPTFRDALSGFWSRFDPMQLATPEAFDADPSLVWGWYEWRRSQVLECQPNAAHRAIAELAVQVQRLTLITQNVDGLHERAGSPDVLCLHGSLHRPYCRACGEPHRLPQRDASRPPKGQPMPPPACASCGDHIRPGVVWFGEVLPADIWTASEKAAGSCDLLMSVGTSSLVYPAAALPRIAHRKGAKLVQINPEPTSLDPLADVNLRGTAAQLLPHLLRAAWPG
ncbi:NAD-dependent deacylase [Thiorhodococcus mannitoliphagus]|uniref:NAD-dependent protein deacylase n=1 Tax=Thiorhodococcus mannitoliphagus TaxID=329406 RepID=A0A6P1DX79_9GAMM|nr:NAD-dependent deacylase [Thiorhodococcus mannitoliphagus]NEX20255.1 NAD-dependent deacylase [Thiorhodococcus mannitoliphagus]